tara:strand:- start:305 stop:520 length:216 start_codon:yes stop_codon:yes gene_type:complete
MNLKRGTLVKGRQAFPRLGTLPQHLENGRYGIILEQMYDPMNGTHNTYKVLWKDGEIGDNIWVGDLEVVEK